MESFTDLPDTGDSAKVDAIITAKQTNSKVVHGKSKICFRESETCRCWANQRKRAKMTGNQMDISEEVRVGELGGNEVKESQSLRENIKRLSGDSSARMGPEEALDEWWLWEKSEEERVSSGISYNEKKSPAASVSLAQRTGPGCWETCKREKEEVEGNSDIVSSEKEGWKLKSEKIWLGKGKMRYDKTTVLEKKRAVGTAGEELLKLQCHHWLLWPGWTSTPFTVPGYQ